MKIIDIAQLQPVIPVLTIHDIAHAVRDALLRSPLSVTDVSVHVEPME